MKTPALTLLLSALTLAAAQPTARPAAPVTVRDDRGSVTVSARPVRIAAAHPISLELLLALGVQPAGYAGFLEGARLGTPLKNIPRYADLLRSEPTFLGSPQFNLEALAALKPDLILSTPFGNADAERQMRRIAPTLLFEYSQGDGWQRAILPLARVLGREKRAQELLRAVERQTLQGRTLLAPTVRRGKRVAMFAVIGPELYSVTPAFPPARQFARLGFEVVKLPGLKDGAYTPISLETVLTAKADRAVLLSYAPTGTMQNDALTFMKRVGYRSIHVAEPDRAARFTTGPLSDMQVLNYYVGLMTRPGVRP